MRTDASPGADRPRGRAEVMAAVTAAAADLLAERGPKDVTVRDIADRAGVNHALVHRHFGSKDELLREVLRQQSAAIGEAIAAAGPRDVAGLIAAVDATPYWRMLARTVLDAPDLLDAAELPAASRVLGLIAGPGEADERTRAAVATAGALVLGRIVFGAHLDAVLGNPGPAASRNAVVDAVAAILGPPR